jgi:pimeloyl-ACP methyl ester carboxylesterase
MVAGQRLECAWIGPGPEQAPTLVFLHHGLGAIATWHDLPAALGAATGCGVLVYSRAGYGQSSPVAGRRSVRFMHDEADTLRTLLAHWQVRDGFLVGHSDGASIAVIASGAPEGPPLARLRGLVLAAPHTFVEPICLTSIVTLQERYREGTLARSLARVHGAQTTQCFESWTAVWLDPAFRSWNIQSWLPRIHCPILVIQGERDEFGTLAQVAAIRAAGGPVSELLLLGSGHLLHRERREAFVAAVRDFVLPLR